MKLFRSLFLTLFMLGISANAISQTPAGSTSTCPSANILGAGLISKVCWSCIFPIVLFNAPLGGGDRPESANNDYLCSCELGSTGIQNPGFSAGLRSVARVMEVVRNPHCSPMLGGVKLFGESMLKGTPKKAILDTGSSKAFFNTNSWSFPLLYMMEALLHKNCTGDATTLNLIGLSSISPTWISDELSFHINPEASIFANPEMLFFGIADGVMTTASPDTWGNSSERDTWFWAIGSWSSSMYPLTGNVPHSSSSPRESSLVAAKSLALSHRIGQARKTMGADNMCGGSIYPMMPKTQYKIQHLFPVTQATKPCCQQMGESSIKWNEWRTLPGYEDYIYLIFRWTDCCMTWL